MYKMVVITAQKYADAKVHTISVGNRELFWVRMIDVQNKLGIKNISDSVRKNIQDIFEAKNPTEKQVRKSKRSQKEISKKPADDSRIKYALNDLMGKIIKNCRGVKKCNDGINRMEKEEQRKPFRAILGFKEHDIMRLIEYSTKLKIKNMFPNEIIEDEYRVLGYSIDLAFPVHKLVLIID